MALSRLLAAIGTVFAFTGCATAGTPVRTSDNPPAIKAADGSQVTVAELVNGHDATVLVFWSSTCPCVRRYQERVDGLLDRYPADRVQVVGVSSNAGETYEKALKTARERGVRMPIYRDDGGKLARYLGAKSTPTVVVLGRDGKVRFFGWFDNEHLPGDSGREAWLDQALTAILSGDGEYPSRTKTFGCTITKSVAGSEEPVQSCSHCQSH